MRYRDTRDDRCPRTKLSTNAAYPRRMKGNTVKPLRTESVATLNISFLEKPVAPVV